MQRADVSRPRTNSWVKVLLMGLLFYVVLILVLFLTGNPNLFPTVLILGSFTVPAAYVSFFYERRRLSSLSVPTTALAFAYGGLLGVLGASLLEPLLVQGAGVHSFLMVGLVEEFVKILGVLVIARHRRHDTELDGLILGAAAGMGFAALESNGYGFVAFISSGNLPFTFSVVFMRALLAPVGHGTWTAILASVLFREGSPRHFRLDRRVLGAYLLVSALHSLWDTLPMIVSQVVTLPLALLAGQFLVGAIGLFILWRRWREARLRQQAQVEASPPRTE
jgi:RsiW-degrading membrane proteinase PrsW (M82 family)